MSQPKDKRTRLITWNINSVRKRPELVRQMLDTFAPDILCLQEIKCQTEQFPHGEFEGYGLDHRAVAGQKGYHGCAIMSRFPLEPLPKIDFDKSGEARDLGVAFTEGPLAGSELYNLYIPAGGDIADPEVNPKFRQKLDYVEAFRLWGQALDQEEAGRIVVGDFNIAPLETDVYSHQKLKKVVSHTEVEREALTRAMEEGQWTDAVRKIIPPETKVYSWWTYRFKDWDGPDRGRRLDHIWTNQLLAERIAHASTERALRGWESPSDHVPVIVDFA